MGILQDAALAKQNRHPPYCNGAHEVLQSRFICAIKGVAFSHLGFVRVSFYILLPRHRATPTKGLMELRDFVYVRSALTKLKFESHYFHEIGVGLVREARVCRHVILWLMAWLLSSIMEVIPH
jgi:hypothetical protein